MHLRIRIKEEDQVKCKLDRGPMHMAKRQASVIERVIKLQESRRPLRFTSGLKLFEGCGICWVSNGVGVGGVVF